MKHVQILPIQEKHCNRLFTMEGGEDLPATVYFVDEKTRAIASHYRLSFAQRLRFIFSGKIYVSVMGIAQPPLAVGVGDLFKDKP